MKPKISVITCVYNTENYVERAILSLVNQTYNNIEIIIINDCSTDNSKKILTKIAKEYKNIHLINNEVNKGLAESRNIGLSNSTGEYIGYIDSDDYISLDYYEELLSVMIKDNADLGITDIMTVFETEKKQVLSPCFDDKLSKINIINTGLAASACNKLFKRDLIEKHKFAIGKVNEDIAVIVPCIINARKIAYASEVYYYYIQRENSIQNSSFSTKRFDAFYGISLTLERIKNCKDFNRIKAALVYQQLVLLLIYIIPKENSFFKRMKILKKYFELISIYQFKHNIYFWKFIDSQGKKHKVYYKLLTYGNPLLSNLAISFYKFYKKFCSSSVIKKNISMADLINVAIKQSKMKKSEVDISVVVPNYNYDKFLNERIYSILNQKVKIKELLILDDVSMDNSRQTIDMMVEKLSPHINIKTYYNEKNSGSPFKQWEKGMNLASGEYVWIAEADDYSNIKFLKNVIKPIIKDRKIIISYCDTSFIDATGNIFVKSIESEIDIMKTNHWYKSYINEGQAEFKNYAFLNCTIANVSSTLIKKGDYTESFKLAGKLRQAGDWVLYTSLMQQGKISYCNKPLNYYRVHGSNITSTMKKKKHIDEILKIHDFYRKNYGFNKHQEKEIKKRYKFLKRVWKI